MFVLLAMARLVDLYMPVRSETVYQALFETFYKMIGILNFLCNPHMIAVGWDWQAWIESET